LCYYYYFFVVVVASLRSIILFLFTNIRRVSCRQHTDSLHDTSYASLAHLTLVLKFRKQIM